MVPSQTMKSLAVGALYLPRTGTGVVGVQVSPPSLVVYRMVEEVSAVNVKAGRTPAVCEKNIGASSEVFTEPVPDGRGISCCLKFTPPLPVAYRYVALSTGMLPATQPWSLSRKVMPCFEPAKGISPAGSVSPASRRYTSFQVVRSE